MELFVSVEAAHEAIRTALPPPRPEIVPLERASGRILIDEVISKEAIPPFPNSAMDGYAVRAGDLTEHGGSLVCKAQVAAGAWPEVAVTAGTCVQIMTGAPMPEGADAVVPVEWTRRDGSSVHVGRGITAGKHLRQAGQDMAVGERVLEAGCRIGSGEIAVLATLGQSHVAVGRRPRVGIVATGNELVGHAETPSRGQIRNSNGPALAARVEAAGGDVIGPLVARDSEASVLETLARCREADIVVFSGGVSMGEFDLVRLVLERQGFAAAFWKVKQRPGKPLVFGLLGGKPVIGLPGNPVSSAVCFDQYVRPAMLLMQGAARPDRPRFPVRLVEDFPKPPGLHVFARATLEAGPDGMMQARPAGPQGSNISMSLVRADALVHLPAEWTSASAGAVAEMEFLDA